jgi:YbaB/EbfC DNA-binding family
MKNLSQMLKQAQEMQSKMAEMQTALADLEVIGQSGGGFVSVTVNGKGDLKRVKIDPKLVDPNEVEGRRARAGGDGETDRRPAASARLQAAVLIHKVRAWPRRKSIA